MKFNQDRPMFRLLDRRVGWQDYRCDKSTWVVVADPPTVSTAPPVPATLTGWDDPDGIRLLPVGGAPGQTIVDDETLLAVLPPHRLAWACDADSWHLLTPTGEVLSRDACTGAWHFVCRVKGGQAVAAMPGRIAVVGVDGVEIWTAHGATQVAMIRLHYALRVAFFPTGDLIVAAQPAQGLITLHRYNAAGRAVGGPKPTKIANPIDRIAVDSEENIWITNVETVGIKALWRGSWEDEFAPGNVADLLNAFSPTSLTVCEKEGFCFQATCEDGMQPTCCYSWDGSPIAVPTESTPRPPKFQANGAIASGWIDSGLPRCRWHRIRIDADVPKGSGIEVSYVATDFDPTDPSWEEPATTDWQTGPSGALDLLMLAATGRFVKIRVTFAGDGQQTPVVWSVRVDFPRRTSLERLPAVFRATPEAEDFTERFLANFDASLEDLDNAILRFPALFDAAAVPSDVLPWLGSFLDVAFDPEWLAAKRRDILAALPGLYRQRGTLTGLIAIFELIFDVTPAIHELAQERPWGVLAAANGDPANPPAPLTARVGAVRLFGKARARFHLGHSTLGLAPLRAYGDPDLDPLLAEAYRFEVQIPRQVAITEQDRMIALIESQKPAHTAATVRFGNNGFVVGIWSAVEIDTAFALMPAPVLGASGNVRLRRSSVVAAGTRRGQLPLTVNVSSIVGVQTLLK